MQLNCNDSILSPWGVGACLLPFLNLIKSFPQTCVENGSLVLMGLLKHMSFSQNKTLVLPEISIFAPCTVLFVSYSSVFASHSPVVQIPLQCFSVKTAASPCSSSKVASATQSVIDFHAPGKHLISRFQVTTSDNLPFQKKIYQLHGNEARKRWAEKKHPY